MLERYRYFKLRRLQRRRDALQMDLLFALDERRAGDTSQNQRIEELNSILANLHKKIHKLRDKLGIHEISRVNQQDPGLP